MAASVYAWRELSFVAPAGWVDETLITLTAPGAEMNLTVARDTFSGPLDAYVRAQEQALAQQRLAGYQAEPLEKGSQGTLELVISQRTLTDAARRPLFQRQVFVKVATQSVAIVTVTARAADRTAATAAVDAVVASLSVSSP